MQNDRFETFNLIGFPLIVINDAEMYEADVSILKQITGNDAVFARQKYVQGASALRVTGNIMLTSNHRFRTRDSSSAIARRLIFFPTVPKKGNKGSLLTFETTNCKIGYSGDFVGELPGILN